MQILLRFLISGNGQDTTISRGKLLRSGTIVKKIVANMKIAFSDNYLWDRFLPFVNTLKSRGHEIIRHPSKNIAPVADVWFVDYHDRGHALMVAKCNECENAFLSFAGKLIFYTLDDGGASYLVGALSSIKRRIDAWITFVKWKPGMEFRPFDVADKFVLIPRYSCNYRSYSRHIKQNRFFFMGNLTGAYNYEHGRKNLRVECIRRIRKSYLNEYFLGGFVGDKMFDIPIEAQDQFYNESFKNEASTPISSVEWQKWMDENLVYLHLQGNSKWSYRQPQAMQTKTAVITPRLENDPAEWFLQDIFGDCFYYVKDDYSDLEDVVEYALLNTRETLDKADFGNQLYLKYLELTPENTFKEPIWNVVDESLSKLGIQL